MDKRMWARLVYTNITFHPSCKSITASTRRQGSSMARNRQNPNNVSSTRNQTLHVNVVLIRS